MKLNRTARLSIIAAGCLSLAASGFGQSGTGGTSSTGTNSGTTSGQTDDTKGNAFNGVTTTRGNTKPRKNVSGNTDPQGSEVAGKVSDEHTVGGPSNQRRRNKKSSKSSKTSQSDTNGSSQKTDQQTSGSSGDR